MYNIDIIYDKQNGLEDLDFFELSSFFESNGLEIDVTHKVPEIVLKAWKCTDSETGNLIAAAVLEMREGLFVLGDLAVNEQQRGLHLGKKLLQLVEDDAKAKGATEIWACAKVPEYYKQYEWFEIDRDKSPTISKCNVCKQFNVSCFPSIIKKYL